MRRWFSHIAPERDAVLSHRWLRPIANRLTPPEVWCFNRRSVARGVALGLFAGFIMPVGQIVLAALFAGAARGNLLVAAVVTLVTNPFTVPPIYYAAYRTGAFVLGHADANANPSVNADRILDIVVSASVPILFGLLLFAITSAIIGFLIVHVAWRVSLRLKWRRRAHRRQNGLVR